VLPVFKEPILSYFSYLSFLNDLFGLSPGFGGCDHRCFFRSWCWRWVSFPFSSLLSMRPIFSKFWPRPGAYHLSFHAPPQRFFSSFNPPSVLYLPLFGSAHEDALLSFRRSNPLPNAPVVAPSGHQAKRPYASFLHPRLSHALVPFRQN